MNVERIELADELRRIARELDRAGAMRDHYYPSKHDTDLLRQSAAELARVREERDELRRLYGVVLDWADGWCPQASCCAHTIQPLLVRINEVLAAPRGATP